MRKNKDAEKSGIEKGLERIERYIGSDDFWNDMKAIEPKDRLTLAERFLNYKAAKAQAQKVEIGESAVNAVDEMMRRYLE